MWAARVAVYGFDLGVDAGLRVLLDHYNPRCEPPWSESELRHKCQDADKPGFKHPRGWLRDQEPERQARGSSRSATTTATDPGTTSATTATAAPPLPGQPCPAQRRPITISNFRKVMDEAGKPTGERLSYTPQSIAREILTATGGWPKACGNRLFVPTVDHQVEWLDDATAFFAWLSAFLGQGGGGVEWGRGEGQITKLEFYAAMFRFVERFGDVQSYPHSPPRPGTYYMHPPLPTAGSGAFDELLDRLLPATEADRNLIRAFFLTLAWGGRLGARPMFIFESAAEGGRPGHGSGKSTAAMIAGSLFGGFVGISLATADDMQVQTRLLSEDGMAARLVLFDNLKGTRVSSTLIESYVTAPVVSGRRLYVGEGKRPNIITWVITANQPSLSKDLTQRSYPIRLTPPVYAPEWNESTDRFIVEHRWQILADILAELETPPRWRLGDGEWSRWPDWERDVLCRVCDPRELMASVRDRRDELDDDAATAGTVRDTLLAYLKVKRFGADPETIHATMTAATMADAIGKLSPHGPSPINVGRWLNSLNIPGLTKHRSKSGRLWVWRGKDAINEEPICFEDLP